MRYTLDIETALANLLTADGYSASAHKIPATLGTSLPHIHVERTGGTTTDLVLEISNVDFDVYADDEADAMTAATELTGWVRNLPGRDVGICYQSEIYTLPYRNPDPRHPNIDRATFKAQIYTRVKEEP